MHGTTFRALKVTSQVATLGAVSAVYDSLVAVCWNCLTQEYVQCFFELDFDLVVIISHFNVNSILLTSCLLLCKTCDYEVAVFYDVICKKTATCVSQGFRRILIPTVVIYCLLPYAHAALDDTCDW